MRTRNTVACCQFDSSMCHKKNTIGEGGSGKLPHRIHFPRQKSESCPWLLLRSTSSTRRCFLLLFNRFKVYCTRFSHTLIQTPIQESPSLKLLPCFLNCSYNHQAKTFSRQSAKIKQAKNLNKKNGSYDSLLL